MKLYLNGHNFRYATEQMLLTLFPGERPEYPASPADQGENHLVLTLSRAGGWASAHALLTYQGEMWGADSLGGKGADTIYGLAALPQGLAAVGSASTVGFSVGSGVGVYSGTAVACGVGEAAARCSPAAASVLQPEAESKTAPIRPAAASARTPFFFIAIPPVRAAAPTQSSASPLFCF